MKIGILTWFWAANYGAQAHSYALCNVIKDMGYRCELVYYYPYRLKMKNLKMLLYDSGCIRFRRLFKVLSIRRIFGDFANRNERSIRVSNGEDIDKLNLDGVLLGSDEIFNVFHSAFDQIYYGVGIEQTPKIAYAPSAGQTDPKTVLPGNIRRSIQTMKGLSGRDKNTLELLRNNGAKNPELVLDPTFLYDFSSVAEPLKEKDYVLVYSFEALDEYAYRVKEYAQKKRIPIIAVGRKCSWADKSYDMASVPQWLGAFQKASLVITDSFHGTVFAIKNQKEFVIVGREDKTNKVLGLMSDLEIKRTYYSGEDEIERYLSEQPLRYCDVFLILEQLKKKSLQYLTGHINNIRKRSDV